ncbi:MAG TPA: MFS transporter, partial [Ktedonobacteraceae bacterium]|nr:MFS transporter [Ktedonobacteraceae bacterium]
MTQSFSNSFLRFAPRKHRGQMLSALFYMQAIGALIANIITVVAVVAVRQYIPTDSATCDAQCIHTVDTCWRWIVGLGAVPPALATFVRWWIPESPRYTMEVEKDPTRATEDVQKYFQTAPPLLASPRSGPGNHDGTLVGSTSSQSMRRPSTPTHPTLTFGEQMQLKDFSLSEPAIPIPTPSKPILRKETWYEYRTGFWKYLFIDGNWTDLLGTSLSWMILDFAFYFLSVNNPKILNKVWNSESTNTSVYQVLVQNGYRALIAVSTGQMMGGAIFIAMARYRWQLQYYGFWMLAGAFVVVGVCFVTLLGTRYFAAVIVLYSLNSLFFDLGPNTSTYVVCLVSIFIYFLNVSFARSK